MGLSVNEIIDLLENDDLEDDNIDIIMFPPTESAEADTDVDSDKTDDETEGDPVHLPRRLLQSEGEFRVKYNNCNSRKSSPEEMKGNDANCSVPCIKKRRTRSVPEDEGTTSSENMREDTREGVIQRGERGNSGQNGRPTKKTGKSIASNKERKWSKNESAVGKNIPPYVPINHPNSYDILKQDLKTALDYFLKMFPIELVDLILDESKRYAIQKNLSTDVLTKDTILGFIGILLLSGYCSLPQRHLYWSSMDDTHNLLVSATMRRNMFDEIMRRIHFADNMKIDSDPYYKVRPLFYYLNEAFKIIDVPENISIDETIVPYYGRHSTKQFIRGKPVRFGFKLWSLCTSNGYLIHAEPYSGSSAKLPVSGKGQGYDVVMGLVEKSNVREGCRLYFDNFFTSIYLLEDLSEKGIGATGTVRENRLVGVPFMTKKEMVKKERGTSDSIVTDDILLVRWNDNKPVTVATNCISATTPCKAARWSSQKKKKIEVPQPSSVAEYNKHMGGVDSHDQFTSTYRIKIRSKKWWWPFFNWGLNASMVNGWRLHRQVCQSKVSLLDFTRDVCLQIMKNNSIPTKVTGPRYTVKRIVHDIFRYDGKDHWMVKGDKPNSRCKYCGRRTVFMCENVTYHSILNARRHIMYLSKTME